MFEWWQGFLGLGAVLTLLSAVLLYRQWRWFKRQEELEAQEALYGSLSGLKAKEYTCATQEELAQHRAAQRAYAGSKQYTVPTPREVQEKYKEVP